MAVLIKNISTYQKTKDKRLIGPLSAPGHTKRAPQEGLPQVRLARRPDDQIHVQRADDCDGGHTKSPFQLGVFNLVMISYLREARLVGISCSP